MRIRGLQSRLYRVEYKVFVSDVIVYDLYSASKESSFPIKDIFKLYIKRWK